MSICGAISLLRRQGLTVPDLLGVLLDAAIAGEEAHSRDTRDALLQPGILVLVGLVHEGVGLDVAVEVIRDEVVVAMVGDAVAEGGEAGCVAKHVGFDGVEDFGEVGVELEGSVVVGMAEVFHVFGQVAEEEDVGFADFACDFDLWVPFVSSIAWRKDEGDSRWHHRTCQ